MVNYNLLYRLQRAKKTPRRELAARAKSEKGPSLGVCSSCKEWKRSLASSLQSVKQSKRTPAGGLHTVQQQKSPLFLHLQLVQAPKMILSDHLQALQTPKMHHFDPLQALQRAKKTPFRLLASPTNLNPPPKLSLRPPNKKRDESITHTSSLLLTKEQLHFPSSPSRENPNRRVLSRTRRDSEFISWLLYYFTILV